MSVKVNDRQALDPRKRRTLQLMQQATMELLAEKDFRRITVQDITARAGINRATFYAHFDDKYALLDFLIRSRFEESLQERIPAPTEFTAENLRLLILVVCEFMGGFSDHCKPIRQATNFEPMIEVQVQSCVYDVLLDWIKRLPSGQGSAAISPEVAATTTSWAIFGSVLRWAHGNRNLSAEQLVDQVLPLVIRGLAGITQQITAA